MIKSNMRLYYISGNRSLMIDTTRHQLFNLISYNHDLTQRKNMLWDIPFAICELFFSNANNQICTIKNNRLLKATAEERV